MNSYDDATKYKIERAGRISLPVFRTVAGFFCGIAVLTVCGRLAVRLTIRRRLLKDDFILLFAFASLGAATGMYYKFSWIIYVLSAMKYNPTVIPTTEDLKAIMNGQAINYSLSALMWSAIYPVKLCFLVSFKDLIAKVSRAICIWYWTTFALTIIFWGLMIALPWIECPYSGTELLMHCTPETPYKITRFGYWFAFLTDIITDVMIVAIPIYILHHVRIRLTQKLAIASFLCLSIVMIMASSIRLGLSRYKGWADLSMQYLLLYLEACVAVTMASLAAYRAAFVEHSRQNESEQQRRSDEERRLNQVKGRHCNLPQIPDDTVKGRIRQFREKHCDTTTHVTSRSPFKLSVKAGGAKMDTVMSFIRGSGKTEHEKSVGSTSTDMSMTDSAARNSLEFITKSNLTATSSSGRTRDSNEI